MYILYNSSFSVKIYQHYNLIQYYIFYIIKNIVLFSLVYCSSRGLIYNIKIKIKLREEGTAPHISS